MTTPLTPPPATRPHAEFSPSGLKFLEICPGFRNRQGTHAKADRGERLHGHVERCDVSTIVDAEEKRQVEFCLDYKRTVITSVTGSVDIMQEVELPIGEGYFLRGNPDGNPVGFRKPDGTLAGYATFGYPDLLVVHDSGVDILDWKFGEWEVADAEDNLQGMAYAVGVFETYLACEPVTVHFVQPSLNKITRVVFSRADYPLLLDRVVGIVRRAIADDPLKRVFNKETCRFCARLSVCHAPRTAVENLVTLYRRSVQMDITRWPTVHSSQVTDPAVAEEMMEVAGIVSEWASSVKKHITDAVLNGKLKLANYSVTERKGRVEVTNTKAAVGVLQRAGVGTSVLENSVDLNVSALMSNIADACTPDKALIQATQRAAIGALAESGFLVEGEPTAYLRRSKTKAGKP